MRFTVLAFLAMLGAALTFTAASPQATLALTNCSVSDTLDSEEVEFLRLINEYRQQNGRAPLQPSDNLLRAAAWKSRHMADNNYFAHDDLPIDRTWVQRLRDCGYTHNTYLGENIAAGNATAAATFEQWRNSPGHNANMLSANYAAIGIARAYSANSAYGWYWTTDFGGVADGFTPTPTPTATPTATPTPMPPPPTPSGVDSDGDGCDDARERGANPALGGQRNPSNPWDFFDTPDQNNTRDRVIALSDILRVAARFGASGNANGSPFSTPPAAPAYHPAFDRTPPGPGSMPFALGPPEGAITISDLFAIAAQFGHTCAIAP